MPGSFEDGEPSAHSSYESYTKTAGAYDSTRTPVGLSILIDCLSGSATPLKHQRILDAGCGTGSYLYALKDIAGSLVGLDGSREMLTQAAQKCGSAPNVTLEEGSILTLRFQDHAFDGVMINQVLHHLDTASDFQQLRQCIGEIFRVLKPTGALCVNTCSREQLNAQGPIWYYQVFPEAAAFIAPLQELRKSIKDRSIYAIIAQSERLRERQGQYVVITARKP